MHAAETNIIKFFLFLSVKMLNIENLWNAYFLSEIFQEVKLTAHQTLMHETMIYCPEN